MDDVIEERVDDILFNFDFMKVADTRKYLKLNIQTTAVFSKRLAVFINSNFSSSSIV